MSILSVENRCRACDYGLEELGFWEDLAIIVDLAEALSDRTIEEMRCFAKLKNEISQRS